jgi:hypothetical protein
LCGLFQKEGHEHGRKVHHPVSDAERGKPSRAQVDLHVNEHAGKKGETPAENEPPVGYERNKTVLQRPHDSHQTIRKPAMAGKSGEARGNVSLIGELLGGRPDGPPDQRGLENAPERQVSAPRFSQGHWRLPGMIEEPTDERPPRRKNGKMSTKQAMPLGTSPRGKGPRRSRIRRFSRRVRKSEAAGVSQGAPDGPPSARCFAGRGAAFPATRPRQSQPG